jgi:hypothetical protein
MDSKFLFLYELGTCPQNLIHTRHMKPWEKHHFAQRGMLKFYTLRHVLHNQGYISQWRWSIDACSLPIGLACLKTL